MFTHYSWSSPCVTLAAYPTKLFSSASAVTQTKPMVTAAPSPIFTRKNPRRRIEGAGELIVNLSNYLLFQLVSAFNKTACYSMMFFLVLVIHWPYLDTETSWSFWRWTQRRPKMESPASPDDVQLHDDGAAEEGCNQECKTQFKGTAQ